MKIAMLILGIIGSFIGLGGGLVTTVGGFGGAAVGILAENNGTATSSAFVFWSGVVAILISALSLIFSVIGGSAKKKNVILIFAIATLVTGLLNIYLYNWFSGSIISIAGLLGLIGAKDGSDAQQPVMKSPLLYIVSVVLVILTGSSLVVKNGKAVIELETSGIAASQKTTPMNKTSIALETQPSKTELPFVGGRHFNFAGGNGTQESITIQGNGNTRVESLGTMSSSVTYEGPFSNPIRTASGNDLLFKNKKVYLMKEGKVETGCEKDGEECVSDLYVIEENNTPTVLNLTSALADKNAIVCRYNEAEDACSEVNGSESIYLPPAEFAVKKGYTAILKQEVFDERGTFATYLKMTVKS